MTAATPPDYERLVPEVEEMIRTSKRWVRGEPVHTYTDDFTNFNHEGGWAWCVYCGDGGRFIDWTQERRHEHFVAEHRRGVRHAKNRMAQLSAREAEQKRGSPTYDTPARWCAARRFGCEEMLPGGSNPRQKYHSEACRKRYERAAHQKEVSTHWGSASTRQMGVPQARVKRRNVTRQTSRSVPTDPAPARSSAGVSITTPPASKLPTGDE